MTRIVGLIPARGGSKGVPLKNSRPLAGRSLVERAVECGRASGVLSEILLSTDDPAIAQQGRRAGLEVPFLRPAEIARDDTPMIDVALHAVDWLAAQGREPDVVLLLQPTSPLRAPEHLRRAVALLGDNDAVCSVIPLPKDMCPDYVMRITETGFLDHFLTDGPRYTRRQDVRQAYKRDGTVFLTRVSVLRQHRDFYGSRCVPLVLQPSESLSIDSPDQWDLAERLLGGASQDPAGRPAP